MILSNMESFTQKMEPIMDLRPIIDTEIKTTLTIRLTVRATLIMKVIMRLIMKHTMRLIVIIIQKM